MSNSYNTGEWRAPRGRRETRRVADARAIIHSIIDFHTAEVLPTQSSHYRVPGAIGSVLLPHQMNLFDVEAAEAALKTDMTEATRDVE